MRVLTAIPIYNEEKHVERVLAEVRPHVADLLLVNDGSTDGSAELLARQNGVHVVTHPQNRGYGAALISAFSYTLEHGYDVLVTMDCDGQHQPAFIATLIDEIRHEDIVSGSRYLGEFHQDTPAPADRRRINFTLTRELNERYRLNLTDSFCGFKAYRREALARLCITERSWGMPLQLWVQAAHAGLRIKEVPVPRVYLDPNRSFGGSMDDAERRLAYYRRVIADAEAELAARREVPGLASCCLAACGAGF
ncbi:MAG: glycosyltransferase family 2 protein [Planctomycetia bacterium]|nr:glycosyltransferase family 2 protein [Planctomycetia bacterium]